jgi:hypothetical protein
VRKYGKSHERAAIGINFIPCCPFFFLLPYKKRRPIMTNHVVLIIKDPSEKEKPVMHAWNCLDKLEASQFADKVVETLNNMDIDVCKLIVVLKPADLELPEDGMLEWKII